MSTSGHLKFQGTNRATLGFEHHWEEFSGTHSGIDHRLDLRART